MAVNLSPIWGAGAQLLDNSGNVLSGGKIYTYAAGTTTQVTTYTSATGGTANSNPIVLNSAGRVPYEIWLTDGQNYKFVLKDSNDVLIGTWDNLSGINSNFIAYTNQQEIQTATAGQTVFNLTTMNYLPATNSLSVFVDGVNQYGPGASYAYEETDSNTVTFTSGLHDGAEVKFTSSQIQNAGVTDASQITYDPPFTNSVATNVEAKLAQTVSVKDFGAVGDGVTDDTVAIQNAVAATAGATLDFLDGVYACDSAINLTVSGTWKSSGAKFLYAGPSNQDIAFNLTLDGTGLTIDGTLIFDGDSRCAKPLYVGNDSDTLRSFSAPKIICQNARKTTSDWGAALLAEGSFDIFDVSGGIFQNVTMAAGAKATPGVAGCVIKASSATRYPRLVYINDAVAKNIYAEGMDYQGDQDGFRIFGPDSASSTSPHKMELFAHNVSGIDCAGRVIKTQCDYAEINGVYIERNMVSAVAAWGIDVDMQTGGGFVRGVQAIYRQNVPVTTVLVNTSVSGYQNVPTAQVDGVQVTNLTATELREVLLIASRETTKPPQVFASGFRVIGPLTAFVRSSPLTNTNGLNISMDGMIGSPSTAAFVTAASSSTGNVFARAVVNLGASTVPFWNRSSTGQIYTVSSIDSPNWLDDRRVTLGTNNIAPTRLGRVAPETGTKTGTEILWSEEVADGDTWSLPAQGWNNDSLYFIKVGFGNNDYALISAGSSAITNISIGSSFQIGSTSEPATGNYRVWTSSTGLFISNHSGSTRQITVKAIG